MGIAEAKDAHSPVLSHFSLQGKVAAVTGGSRGIGAEIVRALAEAGASVGLIYTSAANAAETADKISKDTGSVVKAYQSDVTSKAKITETINQVAEDFGRLDICVANAGIAEHFDSLEYEEEEWRKIMGINLDGAMFTAQAVRITTYTESDCLSPRLLMGLQAGNIFKNQGPGACSMIFTASVSATLVNIPQRQAPYNASKAAVVHLAKSLAVEWIDFARVNCISPGFISTDSMLNVFPLFGDLLCCSRS